MPQPVAVRYGWANVSEGNLFNRAGLLASPFRTDWIEPELRSWPAQSSGDASSQLPCRTASEFGLNAVLTEQMPLKNYGRNARGAKAVEKRRVKRVADNAPFGDCILKDNSQRRSVFSALLRLFRPNSTAWFRLVSHASGSSTSGGFLTTPSMQGLAVGLPMVVKVTEIFGSLRPEMSLYHLKAMSKVMTEKAEQIFVSALEMEAKEDLKVFLDRACQGDDGLRAKVEDMLTLRPQLDKIFPEGGVVFALTEDIFNAPPGPE